MYQPLPSEQYLHDKFERNVETAKNLFNDNKFETVVHQLGRLTLVEFHDAKNSMYYQLKFIFDQKDSTLYISGDLGSAVFSWYSRDNTFWTLTHFAKDAGYFMEKRQINTDIYEYDAKLAKLQIKEFYAELNDTTVDDLTTEATQKLQTFFEDTFENTELPLNGSELEALHDELYGDDWQYWLDDEPDYGCRLGSRPIFWLTALTEIKNHPITFVPSA